MDLSRNIESCQNEFANSCKNISDVLFTNYSINLDDRGWYT